MILLSLLLACDSTEYVTTQRCSIDIVDTVPAEAISGEALVISAYPLTETWDTLVSFDNQEAEVINITKEECNDCSECRELNRCTVCDYCDVCASSCDTCAHSVEVIVPELLSGSTDLLIHNAQGSSDPYSISIRQE